MDTGKYLLAVVVCIATLVVISGCVGSVRPENNNVTDGKAVVERRPAFQSAMASPGRKAYFYYLAAQAEMNAGRMDKAEALLRSAVDADPNSADLKVELAAVLLRKNKIDAAFELIEKALASEPENLPALRLEAGMLYRKKRYAKAAAAYEKALELGPYQQGVYIVLGRLYLDRKLWEDAARVFKKMTSIFPDDYTGYYYLARALEGKGDLGGAKANYLKTLNLAPSLEEPRWQLLEIYQSQQRFDMAAEVCRQILSYDPLNYRASLALAINLRRLGHDKEGLRILAELGRNSGQAPETIQVLVRYYIEKKKYEQALWLLKGMLAGNPDSSSLHYVLAVTFDLAQRPLEALPHFKKVRVGSDFFPNTVLQIASIYQQLGRIEKGIAYLETVLANGETSPRSDYYLYLAGFYEQKKQYYKALKSLTKGLAIDNKNYRLYFRTGVVYGKLGRKNDSIAAMRKALELEPDDPNTLNYLGYTLADLGINLNEAEQMIRKALKLKPEDGYITDSLAWVFYKQGKYAEALEWMQKAIKLVPDDPVIMEHLGDVFLELNKRSQALEAFLESRKLRKDGPSKALEQKIRNLQGESKKNGD